MIGWEEIWDFHTDLRYMQRLPSDRAYLKEQLDLPTAAKMGGSFPRLGGWPGHRRESKSKC